MLLIDSVQSMQKDNVSVWTPSTASQTEGRLKKQKRISAVTPESSDPFTKFWGFDHLRRRRECQFLPFVQDQRLTVVWNLFVHNWAVSVPLHQRGKALLFLIPRQGAHTLIRNRPIRKSIKLLPKILDIVGRHHVHERMSQICQRVEIEGQVDEVVPAAEAIAIKQVQEVRTSEALWQVPEHHCRARAA